MAPLTLYRRSFDVNPTNTNDEQVRKIMGLDRPDRKAAEHAYTMTAFNYEANPVGSRDWSLFWNGWQAALSQPASEPATVKDSLSVDAALPAAVGEVTTDELSRLLPGTQYMDPPDGGSVTVLEQLQRMAHDAELWRFVADKAWFVDAVAYAFDRVPKWSDDPRLEEDDALEIIEAALRERAS